MQEEKQRGELLDKTLSMRSVLNIPSNSQEKIIQETVEHSS